LIWRKQVIALLVCSLKRLVIREEVCVEVLILDESGGSIVIEAFNDVVIKNVFYLPTCIRCLATTVIGE